MTDDKAKLSRWLPGASDEAVSVVLGMVEYGLNVRACMGMDEGFKSFEPEEEHDFVKELRALLAQPSDGALINEGAEPVAVMYEDGSVLTKRDCVDASVFDICCRVQTPLYRRPPAPAPVALPEPQAWVKCIDQLPPVRERLAEPCTVEGRNIPPLNRSVPVIVYNGVSVFGDVIEWFDGALPHRGATHWCALPSAPASTDSRS